jgi:hypothetical protein
MDNHRVRMDPEAIIQMVKTKQFDEPISKRLLILRCWQSHASFGWMQPISSSESNPMLENVILWILCRSRTHSPIVYPGGQYLEPTLTLHSISTVSFTRVFSPPLCQKQQLRSTFKVQAPTQFRVRKALFPTMSMS